METVLQKALIHQMLALNDELLKNGCISLEEHDFIRHLQSKKLTFHTLHSTIGTAQFTSQRRNI